MGLFKNCIFRGQRFVLDGHEYTECEFKECIIVVTRGNFVLKDTVFSSCTFEFGGEAENIKNMVLGILENEGGKNV